MSVTFAPTYADGDPSSHWDDHGLNVSNANGWRILRSLDIEADYCGSIEADDLIGRIHLVMAVGAKDIIDTADPATKGLVAMLAEGGACVTDCSPPLDTYLDSRLPWLLEVAEKAKRMGRDVTWA